MNNLKIINNSMSPLNKSLNILLFSQNKINNIKSKIITIMPMAITISVKMDLIPFNKSRLMKTPSNLEIFNKDTQIISHINNL